ncbi:MAG: acetyl-CoA carboxylase biotin carboxyl carrier protein [Magnetococcales bacterium]|nr:acetyl-CoA carboxylase biotin carboxyl carrier protein [Magnetococcales bacterium]
MNLTEIRQLLKILAGTDVSEIEIREEAQTIRVTRQLANRGEMTFAPQHMVTYAASSPMSLPAVTSGEETGHAVANPSTHAITIQSPMVGTYYEANSPDAPPLIARGDLVKKGQVVCIIEAMKLMNEIESEYNGRIVSILKENASPVEYGEPLFILEPV